MEERTWSNGTKYEKSRKKLDPVTLALNTDDMSSMINHNFILKETKREGFNEQIGMRQMTGQTNLNPFRAENNYVADLEDQDKFLRPQKHT
jgi:hypothetical protein